MLYSTDLYLGTFLIITGFILISLSLRRIMKKSADFSSVLLSENIILTCIGIAFVSRAVYGVDMENVVMGNMELRSSEPSLEQDCDFKRVLMSYGPLIVSLVNSFVSLVIDNYLHYRMIEDVNKRDEENAVREVNRNSLTSIIEVGSFKSYLNKYFAYFAVGLQWAVPILMLVAMYPMEVKEKILPLISLRSTDQSCISMLDIRNENCSFELSNIKSEIRNYIPYKNYLQIYENEYKNINNSNQIDAVVNNIYKIVADLKNNTVSSIVVTSPSLLRKSRNRETCMKICYIDNKKLLVYMFILAVLSYFIPITISTAILTKIHVMEARKPNLKTYVSWELLYNILFWTPAMFDTFLSLMLCSYSMHGVRTSLFNVIGNIYQAVKNFMNTKHFQDNSIVPV